MAQVHVDDVTGEQYDDDKEMLEYGIVWQGEPDTIDVHRETVLNDPDAVADEMHALVDDWRESIQKHIEDDGEGVEECRHCKYRWFYTGSQERATCPNCGNKTPVRRLASR
jgi:adenine-specific DNA methylase